MYIDFQSHIHYKLLANQLGIPFTSTETYADVYQRALTLVGRIGLSPFVHPFLNLERIVYSIATVCLPTPVSLRTSDECLELRSPIRHNLITRAILTDFSSESSLLSKKIENLLATESPDLQTLKYAALLTTTSICQQVLVAAPQIPDRLSAILREVVQSLFLSLGAPRMTIHGINNKVNVMNFLIDHKATVTREEVYRISQVFDHFRYASLPPLIDRLNKTLAPEERFDLTKMTIIRIAAQFPMNGLINEFPNNIPHARRLNFCNSKVHLDGNLVIGEQMAREVRVLMAYDQQSYEYRWGVPLSKDVIWKMTAGGIALINSAGICALLNSQTGQICSAGKILNLVGWSESQIFNKIHMTSSGIGYYYSLKKEIFGGLQSVNGIIFPTFTLKRPPGKFIALGPYVAFHSLIRGTCSVFNTKGEQRVLLNIEDIKAANGYIYIVHRPAKKDQPSILRVPEGDLFAISDYTIYPQITLTLPCWNVQIQEVCDDGMILCLSRNSSYEGTPHFIQIDKKTVFSAPSISICDKICVDKKSKTIWHWSAFSHSTHHFSAITRESRHIGKLPLSSNGEIVYIGYEGSSPIIHFVT